MRSREGRRFGLTRGEINRASAPEPLGRHSACRPDRSDTFVQ
jgi:hypothetical protein